MIDFLVFLGIGGAGGAAAQVAQTLSETRSGRRAEARPHCLHR